MGWDAGKSCPTSVAEASSPPPHLSLFSSNVVADLIKCAQQGTILTHLDIAHRYLLPWGKQLGLTLTQAAPTLIHHRVQELIVAVTTSDRVVIYTDGSLT